MSDPRFGSDLSVIGLPLRLYAAFAARPFGGNIAGVVYDEVGLTDAEMQGIAADLAVPTTGFLRHDDSERYDVRFFSSRAEMEMCGHVTVGIFAALFDDGRIGAREAPYRQMTAAGEVPVIVEEKNGAPSVTLRQDRPRFGLAGASAAEIAEPLGIAAADILAVESGSTGLRHIFVQVPDESVLSRLRPDDPALRGFCKLQAIDTIGVWCLQEAVRGKGRVRLRDLCHGVGDPEEAASGTTNAALASLLVERGMLRVDADGQALVEAEQGFEMGRPSRLTTRLRLMGLQITEVAVGGFAERCLAGEYLLRR